MNRMNFLNTVIDNITMLDALSRISNLVDNTRQSYVVTPNVDHIVKIENDKDFKEIYDNANLVLVDGQPLIWISKLLGNPIKEKISGSDLFPKVCEMSAEHGYKLFFLGAAEGVADIAAEKLCNLYNGLNIVGTYSPKYDFENDPDEIQRIINEVKKNPPDILILALGTPKQEKFYYKYRSEFNLPVALAVGASIDFAAGRVKRAPTWMSKYGLEWFYRLCKEPKRMFKRYIIDDLKIISIIFKYRKNGGVYENNN